MKTISVLMVAAGLLVGIPGLSTAQTEGESDAFDDFEELDLESLLDQVVTTASRHEQSLNEAPISTSVVTAEDIRRSGVTTVPDALRMVPGIDVAATTLTGVNVSARGMNELSANTMLVLVDGRSVYAEFGGFIIWDHLSVSIDEIDRIEVTKSPGSALYGANAFAGVINIITKEPEDLPRWALRSTAAEYGSSLTNFMHSGRTGGLTYKISGGLSRVDEWDRFGTDAQELPRFNGLARYQTEDGSKLSLSAGRTEGGTNNFPSSLGGVVEFAGVTGYGRADYEKDNWHLRAYWNHLNLDIVPEDELTFNPVTGLETDNVDVELQHSKQLTQNHLLIWGGSYRHNFVKWSILDENYTQDLFSASAYDEWRLASPVTLSLGLRYDYHPLVQSHLSPRASIVYRPQERHTLRASVGRAHRNPTYVESYFQFDAQHTRLPGFPITLAGNRDLRSEQISSYEVGYQGQLARRLVGSVDLYHNRIRGLIDIGITETYGAPPAPVPGIPSALSFQNQNDLDATGGEIALNWRLNGAIATRANYAFVHLVDPKSGDRVRQAPQHKLNLGLDLGLTRDLTLNLFGRYVSRTEWVSLNPVNLIEASAGDFFALDAHAVYALFPDRVDLAIGGRNLFDQRYQEYPPGMVFRSQVYATVDVRF